jgi:hypothetical protein
LIVLGAGVILLLLGFNWIQDLRVRRRMQAELPKIDQDPLLGEPTFSERGRREPGLGGGAVVLPFTAGGAQGAPDADTLEPDSATEAVIELTFQGPMAGEDLAPLLMPLRVAGRKEVRVFVQNVHGQHALRIDPKDQYISVQLAILLANRSGALNAIEWSQIFTRAQTLADQLECTLEAPEQQQVVELAKRLDQVCERLDTQVGLTLLLAGVRSVSDVSSAAQAMGFVPYQGRFAWCGDDGFVCFTLSRADEESFDAGMAGVDRLSLLLDVPRSPVDTRAFGRMAEIGHELARRLGAELVDDQDRALQPGAEFLIDEQLKTVYMNLEHAGLNAGGARALRVFV